MTTEFWTFPEWATERQPLYVGSQLWVCNECRTVRQWGEGASDELGLMQLRCIGCKSVTAHHYAGVSRGFTE